MKYKLEIRLFDSPKYSDVNGGVYINMFRRFTLNSKYHREDGPAKEWDIDWREYYLNDIEYKKEQYLKELETIKNARQKSPTKNYI